MEPLFFPEDEQSLLPQELHPRQNDLALATDLETGRDGRNAEGFGADENKPTGGGDGSGRSRGGGSEEEIKHDRKRRGKAPYDRHSVHVVTQYYIPDDPSRAREVWR